MNEPKLNTLDCTLRDGGYYNNWDFEASVVSDYLESIAEAGIDFVELGLRQFNNTKYLGAHAYTTKEYLDRLDLPKGPTYGVMIDAKTVLSEEISQEDCINKLFLDAKDEKVSLVRVAAHFTEVRKCLPMLTKLKEKGYLVGLNIMQASLRSDSELEDLSSEISNWDCVDVVYFADSLGSMDSSEVARVYDAIRKNWNKDIGFHAHNNMGQAISNTNKAIKQGCNWVDSTVTGMGRGAGNAQTEYLLLEPKIRKSMQQLDSLFSLSVPSFESMKKLYGWGSSVPYYIGALKNIHPTYIQELCADKSIKAHVLPNILNDIGNIDKPYIFNKVVLDSIKSNLDIGEKHVKGNKAPNIFQDREILIVAQTQSALKYQDAIEDYANKKNPILVSINYPKLVTNLEYDYIVISHNEKFREDQYRYQNSKFPFIAPKKLFLENEINIAHDYGFSISENEFKPCGSYAKIPFRLTLAYALGFSIDAGSNIINLAGFSGFNQTDPRQKEMESFLSIISSHDISLKSLTPTTFSIEERSIYAI